ncbi:MAG: helix-turn-helix transcriptional regulator [Nanoarchaeota archaeon]
MNISKIPSNIDAAFSSVADSKHVLHLYAPTVNKYLIHARFLSDGNEKTAYVTGEDPEMILKRFQPLGINFEIISPRNMDLTLEFKKILIDAVSINSDIMRGVKERGRRKRLGEEEIMKDCIDHSKREKYLNSNFKNHSILCTYDISKLNPKKIKELVKKHDRLILTTDSATVLSSKKFMDKRLLGSDLINEFVKRELKTIVLALLIKKSMCGRDIKMQIYNNFSILLSSGTLYPLLHELERNGLLKCHHMVKAKIYSIAEMERAMKILNEHMQVKNFLNNFLQSTIERV